MPGGHSQTLRPFLWRAERLYPDTEIVSRTHEGRTRHTYAEYADRTAQLANALDEYGIERGDRVATFCWNHTRHFETYFGVPSTGAQLHTINPLLPDEHIQYIVDDAADEIVFVDASLAPKLAGAADGAAEFDDVDFVSMGSSEIDALDATPYEEFIADQPTDYDWPDLDSDQPAGLCYTSGTTGKPKGVSTPSRCCGATRWPPRRHRGSRWRTPTWSCQLSPCSTSTRGDAVHRTDRGGRETRLSRGRRRTRPTLRR